MRKRSEKDLGTLIRSLGGDWKKFEDRRYCPHCKQLIYRVANMPYDGLATVRGYAIPIEIKSGKKSFRFADLKEHQRQGLGEWQLRHIKPTWIAIMLGTGKAGSSPKNIPLRFWLMPYKLLLMSEGALEVIGGSKSIPYSTATTRSKKIKEHKLTAVDSWRPYELIWEDGKWTMPKSHTFRFNYINQTYKEPQQ